jgi:hypothetical protein
MIGVVQSGKWRVLGIQTHSLLMVKVQVGLVLQGVSRLKTSCIETWILMVLRR